MLSRTYGFALHGVDALPVTIEVNVFEGTQRFMVGLPDNAVKESMFRIESVFKVTGYYFPRKRIVINLAPADLKKEGTAYDLPIALCLLVSSGQLELEGMEEYAIMGELALDGSLRPIKGVLPIAMEARKMGLKGFVLPKENATEAAIVNQLDVIGVESLQEAIDFFQGETNIVPLQVDTRDVFSQTALDYAVDFADVQGQENIKRGLEIAAAGGHNLIMIGPPGAGKTMLAKRLPTILPPLTLKEALETTKIHSVAGLLGSNSFLIKTRPFRSPHHTVSDVALVGGGGQPQPGEISLAHNGVLFLDELPEFKRAVLEVLRQPLEERRVTVSRARATVEFPANFMLVASMNPSPSGDFYDPATSPDTPADVQRYLRKISGPLMDRIDLHIEVTKVSFNEMTEKKPQESSDAIRERVIEARNIQANRFEGHEGIHNNAMMPAAMVKEVCVINPTGKLLLKTAMEKLNLSARAYDRILKVSRTIADLADSEEIEMEHLAEAIQYRSLDREGWLGAPIN